MIPSAPRRAALSVIAGLIAAPVAAQDVAGPADPQPAPRATKAVPTARGGLDVVGRDKDDRPRRFRVALGVQGGPGFPGNDAFRLGPLISVAKARGDDPFPYGGVGDGPSLTLLRSGRFEAGPMLRLEGIRRADDLGGGLPRVARSFEPGVFAQFWPSDAIRLRGDVRKGVSGHEGWVSTLAADYVARDGDAWLVSIGPRVMLSDARYQRAWFGVTPDTAARTGLAVFSPGSGVHSAGLTSRVIYQFTPRWGVLVNGSYARLVGDAGDSPVTRVRGSRDQLAAGLGLSYTFRVGGGR
ncbi:MipA/OmpV family protein [Sphingomonas adhaesiva]|uniref:MipA/OmpV family protein n=1 Tax=Sphingomonas adhaesiva TaxID=28212 RepID=UPI002FFC0410